MKCSGLGAAILGLFVACTAMAEPIRILPLGDSITQGGRVGRPEYTYRLPLQRMLIEAGYDFDFVGSMKLGLDPVNEFPKTVAGRPFDPDHEGHYGWKTGQIAEKLPGWVANYPKPPDIVLVHLGTNDQKAASPATTQSSQDPKKTITDEKLERELFTKAVPDQLEKIIETLRAANPKVIILVGHLNFKGGSAVKIRPLVEDMAKRLSTADSPIVTVHHYKTFNADPSDAQSDTFDWAHPNPKGQQTMATAWFEAMKPFLEKMQPRGANAGQ